MREHIVLKPKKEQVKVSAASLPEFWARADRMMKQVAARAFQLFEERGCEHGHDLDDWLKAEEELLTPVPIKIKETENAVHIVADVQGFNHDELAFNLENNQLAIQGFKHTSAAKDSKKAEKNESEIQMIYGSILLPSDVVPQKAHATLKNGVLEIIAPKSATEIAKTIAVSAA